MVTFMNSKIMAGLIGLCVCTVTFAATPEFKEVDANKDGQISAEEAKMLKDFDFDKADKDDDGMVDHSEYDHADD